MIVCISLRMRATSRSPISWISSGVSSVVVNQRTRSRYHCAPPGVSQMPTLVRVAGRYSCSKNACRRRNAGTTSRSIEASPALLSRCCSISGSDAGMRLKGA